MGALNKQFECVVAPQVMGRREAFLSLGGYRDKYAHAEDYDLWVRMVCAQVAVDGK